MSKLKIQNLTKKYGKTIAVKNLSMEVEDGEFLVLLGPSGCGKTTTLRCIAGLEIVDEGEIYIGDRLVNDLPPKDRNIAMVFQSYALYPHMTVFDNIAFPLKMRKLSLSEIQIKVKQVADLLGIVNLLDRKPNQLSGGEAQRVALGRALVKNPDVFLLDEPLSNLDAKLRMHMRAELKKLQRDLGITTIYVTHDQIEAMAMADEIAIMDAGMLQQIASPKDIYNIPQNIFVATFIGSPSMNLIDCSLEEKNGKTILNAGVFNIVLPKDLEYAIKKLAVKSELVLGIRPEDILIHSKKCSDAIVKGKIHLSEPLGSETIYHIDLGICILKVKSSSDLKINVGEEVWLSFNVDKINLFDKKTGENLIYLQE